jgi:hypothetical protein
VAKTGIVGPQSRFDQLVAVEIDEHHLTVRKFVAKAGLIKKEVGVSMMAWSFTDDDGGRIEPEKGLGRGTDELGIGVHGFARDVFNDVGFE